MNNLTPYKEKNKHSFFPAITKKQKFEVFCDDIDTIKEELRLLLQEKLDNDINHKEIKEKIKKILIQIVNNFLKNIKIKNHKTKK
jgi:hypothetical protein